MNYKLYIKLHSSNCFHFILEQFIVYNYFYNFIIIASLLNPEL
jgi:hypothetical protein